MREMHSQIFYSNSLTHCFLDRSEDRQQSALQSAPEWPLIRKGLWNNERVTFHLANGPPPTMCMSFVLSHQINSDIPPTYIKLIIKSYFLIFRAILAINHADRAPEIAIFNPRCGVSIIQQAGRAAYQKNARRFFCLVVSFTIHDNAWYDYNRSSANPTSVHWYLIFKADMKDAGAYPSAGI